MKKKKTSAVFGQPSVQRVYRMASQTLLDTPRPKQVRIQVRNTQKPAYEFSKEPSNGRGVGP